MGAQPAYIRHTVIFVFDVSINDDPSEVDKAIERARKVLDRFKQDERRKYSGGLGYGSTASVVEIEKRRWTSTVGMSIH